MSEPNTSRVTTLRESLVRQATAHHEVMQRYLAQHMSVPKDKRVTDESKLVAAAVMGNAMADTYATALAGTLGLIEREHGTEAAALICLNVALMLSGDLEDANSDIE